MGTFPMIELEHSPLGGSSVHRYMACIASFLLHRDQLENGTFENVESEFAKLGTASHELGAKAISQALEPFMYIGQEFGGYKAGWEGGIGLDALAVYFNDCMKILTGRKSQGRLILEETIHLPDIHPLFKGTADFCWYGRDQGLWLRDYKNGEGVGVPAIGNKQLLYYAALVIMSDPWLRAADRNFPVNLGIVQPNFYGIFEEPEIWEVDLGFVLDWLNNELLPTMWALSSRRDAVTEEDHVPGPHCLFCPVILDCIKLQKAYVEYAEASEDFVTMLTNAELDHYYAMREPVKRFGKALEETVLARKLTGADIPSAKLVNKMTRRVWKPGAAKALEASLGEKAYKAKELLSPAAVEKLSTRGKELAVEWSYKPEEGQVTIAPLSDRRLAVDAPSNAKVFQNFGTSSEDMGF